MNEEDGNEDRAPEGSEEANRRLTPLFRSVFQDIPTEETLIAGIKLGQLAASVFLIAKL